MVQTSFLRSPKKEEQQVLPQTVFSKLADNPKAYLVAGEDSIHMMDELEGILDIEDEENLPHSNEDGGQPFFWDFLDSECTFHGTDDAGFIMNDEDGRVREHKVFEDTSECFLVGQNLYSKVVSSWDNVELCDEVIKGVPLNLSLNYQEVLEAWSGRGSLSAFISSPSSSSCNDYHVGEIPVMEEERTRRKARVLRYKEKRQSRLFSKKIRYQVRKLNAVKRPRIKGRFVKRA